MEAYRPLIYPGEDPAQVCVSIPVMGELQLKLAEGFAPEQAQRANDNIQEAMREGRLETFGMGGQYQQAIATAAKMRERDGLLDPTDSVIIACALVDRDAHTLYMNDSMVESVVIQRFADKHGTQVKPI